jgi:hypothetical protein
VKKFGRKERKMEKRKKERIGIENYELLLSGW